MYSVVIFLLYISASSQASLTGIPRQIFDLDRFTIEVTKVESKNPTFSISKRGNDEQFMTIWKTAENQPFLRIANATELRPPISNGNYQVEQEINSLSDTVSINKINVDDEQKELTLSGNLLSTKSNDDTKTIASYKLKLSITKEYKQLSFSVEIIPAQELTNLNIRSFFTYSCDEDEGFYGFGESFSFLNLKGLRVPILVSEQGVGRGEEPITSVLNKGTPGVGGYWYTTYAPKPIYLTNKNISVFFQNSDVFFFDLTSTAVVEVEIWADTFSGFVFKEESMLDLVGRITENTGRQDLMPEWTQKGAIVGLEGGTDNVTKIVNSLYEAGVPMAGIWLQDWVGLQHLPEGDRLIWNWEVNYDYYPGWHQMIENWTLKGTKVLTYINPFFSDPTASNSSNSGIRRNFFQEGVENGFFVKNSEGSTYLIKSLSIEFAMLDLTNPDAVRWMKDIIIDQSIVEASSSGWMCDFGEYLPFDAVLFNGDSARNFHNLYPEKWAQLTAEAVEEAKTLKTSSKLLKNPDKNYEIESEVMFFMRAGWFKSPRYTPVFWLGDQLISWDENDGLKSVLTGAFSSGLTGHTITHSDIGGYTTETDLGPENFYVRSPELLKRWTELSAFGFGLFRTHIGSSTTPLNAQVYDSPESMAHFAEFAGIYAEMADYRLDLMKDARDKGYPLIRPMFLHYAYDLDAWDQKEQFLVGTEFLVAPCMNEGEESVKVYFPPFSGTWIHLWSDEEIVSSDNTIYLEVSSPIGFPAVFYHISSTYGERLREYVKSRNFTDGYEWI